MAIIKISHRPAKPEKSFVIIGCDECWRRIRIVGSDLADAEDEASRYGWLCSARNEEHFCPKHY